MKNYLKTTFSLLCKLLAIITITLLLQNPLSAQTFEDGGILKAFQERNEDFTHVEILEKRYITPRYSAVIAKAANTENWRQARDEGRKYHSKIVILILDKYMPNKTFALDFLETNRFYVSQPQFRDIDSNYVIVPYAGTDSRSPHAKYFFDAEKRCVVKKINFSDIVINSIIAFGDSVFFTGENYQQSFILNLSNPPAYFQPRMYDFTQILWETKPMLFYSLKIEKGELIATGKVWDRGAARHNRYSLTNIGWKLLEFKYIPESQWDKNYRIREHGFTMKKENGDTIFYKLPTPNSTKIKEYRPHINFNAFRYYGCGWKIIPADPVNNLIWFGNEFYSGEGCDGVGCIGYFDLISRSYEIFYLKEALQWSASSIYADDTHVIVGLYCFTEGSRPPKGLLKFEKETQTSTKYPINELISAIGGYNGIYFIGSTNRFYVLDNEQLFHVTIDFDIDENYYIKKIQSIDN
jgi:hypothetical protein